MLKFVVRRFVAAFVCILVPTCTFAIAFGNPVGTYSSKHGESIWSFFSSHTPSHKDLARLTAYWTGEDRWTRRHQSATGIRLRQGYCAVDPRKIPYGSVVTIPGMGKFLAVDTGTAVVTRRAAVRGGRTSEEKNALVIDIYFNTKSQGKEFETGGPKFAKISWSDPLSKDDTAIADRENFTGVDWTRLQSLETF